MIFQFDSFAGFLDMGGYGLYVWPVYGLFAVFILFNIISPLRTRKIILKQLQARLKREEER